ncbi:MAG: hypothetical protein IPG77_25355 [Betaproteobacteria bacterium]|nr:hypothetical protein [Betaproteobacteria bacterium]
MEMIAVLRWMFPGLDASMMAGRTQVFADRIGWWDDALGAQPTPAEIAAAELPAAKAIKTAANRAECERRIYARYPAGRQSSVALGIYSGAEAEAQAAIMKDWISDMVAAENAAADAIEAATTVQQVEAVAVTWPA